MEADWQRKSVGGLMEGEPKSGNRVVSRWRSCRKSILIVSDKRQANFPVRGSCARGKHGSHDNQNGMIRGEASTSPQSSWYVHVKKKERNCYGLLVSRTKEEPTGLTVTCGRNDNNTLTIGRMSVPIRVYTETVKLKLKLIHFT